MTSRTKSILALIIAAAAMGALAQAALRGHGGPVRAMAISADGKTAATGSFDSSAILWNLENDSAIQVLRFHAGAVNAIAILTDGRIATAGEDAKIALWRKGRSAPDRVLEGHSGPIAGLAASLDGKWLASASWDRTARLWPLDDGEARVLAAHADNVNAAAFFPNGEILATAGYDATLRLWPVSGGAPTTLTLPAPVNAIAIAQDGEIIAGCADGQLRLIGRDGVIRREIEIAAAPIIAVAVSPDGETIAAAGLRGSVALIKRREATQSLTLVGPALPVWSLAFAPDNRTLFAAGSDRIVRRWDAQTGETRDGATMSDTDAVLKMNGADPGAEVFKACVACHTLTADDGHRAGPSLYRLFGRRIATAPGYHYSEALKKMDIVWTPETVSKLFELGPNAYTPGTKMPEQTLSSAADRDALVKFLARVAQ